jgi:hypothetical protein
MPNVFPILPGLSFSSFKAPMFKTRVQRGISGRTLRVSFQPVPTWSFKLKFDILRDKWPNQQPGWTGTLQDELRTLMGFFLGQQGSLIPFLYQDPTDYFITGQQLGNGNGSLTTYQLIRTMYDFNEPIIAPNAVTAVYINGTPQSTATWSVNASNGVITFTSPPANETVITADFSYYFLCAFSEDTYSFEYFMYQLWQLGEMKFESVLL